MKTPEMAAKPKRKRRTKGSVVSLFGAAPLVPRAHTDIVERLEFLLGRAKDGLVIGFCYAIIESNGTIATGWDGDAEAFRMQAGAASLNHRIFAANG